MVAMNSGRSARRQALLIIGTVAAYTIVETLLLLSVIGTVPMAASPTPYRIVILFSQLLAVPGIAALFSWLMYGPDGWIRRATFIVVLGPLIMVSCFIGFLFLSVAVGVAIDKFAPEGSAWSVSLLVLLLCGIIVGIVFGIKWTGNRSVQIELARWIGEREAGTSATQRKSRNRAIGAALFSPSATVLLIFLFFPEVWGIASHVGWPGAGRLCGYKVPIPLTWIVAAHETDESDGTSYLNGLASRSPGFAKLVLFRPLDVPLSSWGFTEYRYSGNKNARPELPKKSALYAERTISIGNETITCLDYWPGYFAPKPRDASVAYIKCSGASGLIAWFDGERADLPKFYEMLSGIKPIP